MKKVYYLGPCSTCERIINELGLKKKKFEFQEIRTEKITRQQLEEMKSMAGSYEALFSRIAIKYKALDPKPTTEAEYKKLILSEDTFLKRPVIIYKDQIFIGNTKGNIDRARAALEK